MKYSDTELLDALQAASDESQRWWTVNSSGVPLCASNYARNVEQHVDPNIYKHKDIRAAITEYLDRKEQHG